MSKTHPDPDPAMTPDAWGEVRSRDQVVRYRRSGAGRTVLLLQAPGRTRPLWPEVLDILCTGARLIEPEPPAAEDEIGPWLTLMLEGLGLADVTIVALEGFCMAALERALVDPDRISRIILGCDSRDGMAKLGPEAIARLSAVPLLVIGLDQPVTEVVERVAGFMRGR
jgi:hypothetical protein